jgi:archaellin
MLRGLETNKKAEMGVGVLIVFIAMLLVAAIAAGVLITTVTSLQQKALVTGAETRGEISTHIRFIEVSGTDGTDGSIENLTAIIKLASGSDSIDLDDVLLSVALRNDKSTLRYNETTNYSDGSDRFGRFNVTYLVQGSEYREGFMVRGDVIEFDFYPPRNISEDETVRITMIPKVGTQALLEFRTPTVISRHTIFLFP